MASSSFYWSVIRFSSSCMSLSSSLTCFLPLYIHKHKTISYRHSSIREGNWSSGVTKARQIGRQAGMYSTTKSVGRRDKLWTDWIVYTILAVTDRTRFIIQSAMAEEAFTDNYCCLWREESILTTFEKERRNGQAQALTQYLTETDTRKHASPAWRS